MAPRVAELMAGEMKQDHLWAAGQIERFEQMARNYCVRPDAG